MDNRLEFCNDCISQFLLSPYWKNPIDHFIDEYSVFFNPSNESFPLQETHQAYQGLVSKLLQTHLSSLGISTQEFMNCSGVLSSNKNLKECFEYFTCVNDVNLFKQKMEKRNIDLELDTMNEMKKMMKSSCEEEILKRAIQESLKDEEIKKKEMEREDAELKIAIAMSLASNENEEDENEEESIVEELEEKFIKEKCLKEEEITKEKQKQKEMIEILLKEKKKLKLLEEKKKKNEKKKFESLKFSLKELKEENKNETMDDVKERVKKFDNFSSEEKIQMKMKIMKLQREKLLKLRESQRVKKEEEYLLKLKEEEEITSKSNGNGMMMMNKIKPIKIEEEQEDNVEDRNLEMRKALSFILKKNLIFNKQKKKKQVQQSLNSGKFKKKKKAKLSKLFDNINVKDES